MTCIPPQLSMEKDSEGSKECHLKEGISPPPVAAFESIMYGNILEMALCVSGEV